MKRLIRGKNIQLCYLSFFIFSIFFSCQDAVKSKLSPYYCKRDIKSITIYNKTENNNIPQKVEVNDKDRIKQFCYELNNLKEFPDARVKTGHGFFEIDVHLTNNEGYKMDLIYTVYDGVIIDDHIKLYKNDELESFVLNAFQK